MFNYLSDVHYIILYYFTVNEFYWFYWSFVVIIPYNALMKSL